MSEKTKKWFKAAGIRAVKTVAQTAIATIGTTALITEVNWAVVAAASTVWSRRERPRPISRPAPSPSRRAMPALAAQVATLVSLARSSRCVASKQKTPRPRGFWTGQTPRFTGEKFQREARRSFCSVDLFAVELHLRRIPRVFLRRNRIDLLRVARLIRVALLSI